MATKLKNMKLTSVDLVKAGANQKADICLYKSADSEDTAQEATGSPTETEKGIFKRFIGWLHENLTDGEHAPENPIEKGDNTETPNEDIYKCVISESLKSIVEDETLSTEEKTAMIEKSIEQYHDAMVELMKFNPYHGSDGRFSSASGGGAAVSGAGASGDGTASASTESGASSSAGVGSGTAHKPFQIGNAHDVLSGMQKGDTVTIRTDKKETVYTKASDGKLPSAEWKWKYPNGSLGYISAGNLADIINSGGNRVVGKIKSVETGHVGKSADIEEIEEVEVEKINHNHDRLGRFASANGGGAAVSGGLKGSDVRDFGVPGTSGSYHMDKKEKKLAQTIIDNEELDLKIQDGKDAYGNITTSFHGTREDYSLFKEMWNMVAPSELGKSADIEEV